jgi:hypothetical protein
MIADKTTTDGPPPNELAPGTEVELIKNLIASHAETLRAYRVIGGRPAGSVTGRDYFGVRPGEKALVVRQEGDAVQIQILGGPWKERAGWVSRDGVRVLPTHDESSADVVDGLSQAARREIYGAYQAVGMNASELAESQCPFSRMPLDAEAAKEYLAERNAVYETAKERGRREILERYKIEGDQLDGIEAEGMEKPWPLWDGLSDERGPIPNFGPAPTDDRGRIVMTKAEWDARREAAGRALKIIGNITDESDTDERWAEVFRGLEGAH